jgi:hypothetical protein
MGVDEVRCLLELILLASYCDLLEKSTWILTTTECEIISIRGRDATLR